MEQNYNETCDESGQFKPSSTDDPRIGANHLWPRFQVI